MARAAGRLAPATDRRHSTWTRRDERAASERRQWAGSLRVDAQVTLGQVPGRKPGLLGYHRAPSAHELLDAFGVGHLAHVAAQRVDLAIGGVGDVDERVGL